MAAEQSASSGAPSVSVAARCAALSIGDGVLCWPGERKGPGYLMFVAHEGVHDVGGTPCIYVRPMGGHSRAIALSHVEVPGG